MSKNKKLSGLGVLRTIRNSRHAVRRFRWWAQKNVATPQSIEVHSPDVRMCLAGNMRNPFLRGICHYTDFTGDASQSGAPETIELPNGWLRDIRIVDPDRIALSLNT